MDLTVVEQTKCLAEIGHFTKEPPGKDKLFSHVASGVRELEEKLIDARRCGAQIDPVAARSH